MLKRFFDILEYGPSFAERQRWRDILIRLSEFLRLVDYVVLEFLRRLVKSCVRDLFIHLRESFAVEFKIADSTQENIEDTDERFHLIREKSASTARSLRAKQALRPESQATSRTDVDSGV